VGKPDDYIAADATVTWTLDLARSSDAIVHYKPSGTFALAMSSSNGCTFALSPHRFTIAEDPLAPSQLQIFRGGGMSRYSFIGQQRVDFTTTATCPGRDPVETEFRGFLVSWGVGEGPVEPGQTTLSGTSTTPPSRAPGVSTAPDRRGGASAPVTYPDPAGVPGQADCRCSRMNDLAANAPRPGAAIASTTWTRGLALSGVTVFLGAFLLFLVQPIIAKLILPRFGGSVAVWATCLVFFQAALLLGYAYAHHLVRHAGSRRWQALHLALLVGSLALLPIVPVVAWPGGESLSPQAQILGLLILTIGLPFTLLSMTGPLLQAWQAELGRNPYRLFAVSNGASLVALLAYPWAIEPWLPTSVQAVAWSAGYACYALAMCTISLRRRPTFATVVTAAAEGPAGRARSAGSRWRRSAAMRWWR
jgi:hypothetical protein